MKTHDFRSLSGMEWGQNLNEQDLAALARCFITAEISEAARLVRVTDMDGASIVGRERSAGKNFAGILFPYYSPQDYGYPREYRLRRDQPDMGLDRNGEVKEEQKYLSPPARGNMIYFPPAIAQHELFDPKLPVVITEGEKKALALCRLSCRDGSSEEREFLPVALSGVWNFRGRIGKTLASNGEKVPVKGIIPDFELFNWKKRTVYLLFDSNVSSNPGVRTARYKLGRDLAELGAKILYAELPEDCGVNGVDDYLGRIERKHGTRAAIDAGFAILTRARKPENTKNPTPSNFQLITSGEDAGVYFIDDDGERSFVCGPLEILAETHTKTGDNYGRLLRWEDSKVRLKTWAMPIEMVHSEGTELVRRLASLGLKVGTSRKQYEQLRMYINLSEPERTVVCTTRIGWHDKGFVLPDEYIGSGDEVAFQSESAYLHKFNTRGTVEGWRGELGKYCEGNSRLTSAVSAFAAALLPILDVPGGGIHFRGTSSTGKTTLLQVAGSVWGGSEDAAGYCQTWRVTANGLESVCEGHNHALLCLDEIGECDPRQVGDVAYMIANGQGKQRMSKSITARRSINWQLLFLSSGEQRLSDKMLEAGQRVKGGQEIRLCEIEADTGKFGTFEELHGFANAQTFADQLRTASKSHHGTAIREFLRYLVSMDIERVRGTWTELHKSFLEKVFQIHRSPTSEVRRVATRFALIAFAGEIATQAGITGWVSSAAANASHMIFQVWEEGRMGDGITDAETAIRQVRAFLEAHGQSRFQNIDNAYAEAEKVSNRVGFNRTCIESGTAVFYVLPESFNREVCKGLDAKFVWNELQRRGYLVADREKGRRPCGFPNWDP